MYFLYFFAPNQLSGIFFRTLHFYSFSKNGKCSRRADTCPKAKVTGGQKSHFSLFMRFFKKKSSLHRPPPCTTLGNKVSFRVQGPLSSIYKVAFHCETQCSKDNSYFMARQHDATLVPYSYALPDFSLYTLIIVICLILSHGTFVISFHQPHISRRTVHVP